MGKRRIGILTSGGDCPGLNAVLYGTVHAASARDWEIVGFHDGFEGMLPPARYTMLDLARTEQIMPLGGTILGTTNKGHFISKVGGGRRSRISAETLATTRKLLESLDIEGLIIVGGDGSQNTALQLSEAGIPVVGVPKTIDNDLEATATTFGFDSAVACVTDSLDRLHPTTASHKRVMVVEVMGRHAGWIALHGGFAGGAHVILIPEIPFDFEKIAAAILQREKSGHPSTLVVVAEGARPKQGRTVAHRTQSGEFRLGGVANVVARELAHLTGKETRTCTLGHLQRGGSPTPLDRILGIQFGVQAVELLHARKFGHMVSYQNYRVCDVPIRDAVHRLHLVAPNNQLVQMARAIHISFGD